MRGWMSQDGESSGPSANLLCRFGTGWRDQTGSSNKTQQSGGRKAAAAGTPRPGAPKLCLPARLGWTMAPGCTVMGTAQLVPRASSRHPAGHGARTQRRTPGRMGRESPLGWGGVLGLPRALCSGRTQDGWRRHPREAGGGCRLCPPPQSLGQREMGMPAGTPSPAPAGESWWS